tara:strand:+ start:277 stop:615 length:339 start_codon:yes stop_codon:yes gene_type:complete
MMSASYETEEINTKYEKIDVEQGLENLIKKDIPQTIELEEELENPLQKDIPQAIEVEEQEAVEISQNEERDISFNNMVAKERASIQNCARMFFCFAFAFVGFILFDIFVLRK